MRIDLEKEVSFCCGCGACAAVCPKNLIEMHESEKDGFIYPNYVEDADERCINCGACASVCSMLSPREGNTPINVKGFINKNEIAQKSASGGAFPALATYVIANGGVVYGCILDEKNQAVTERTETMEGLEKMLCSKYVQCNTKHSFGTIRNDLNDARMVLYCSTPCQVAGLLNYLGKPFDNLITMDLFCHGMPSPGLWREYLNHLTRKHHAIPQKLVFRDKALGWENCIGHYEAKGIHQMGLVEDTYWRAFVEMKTYQNSCYECPYAKETRVGDFSIGDYWGIRQEHPEIDTRDGVSAVVLNTPKAVSFFELMCSNAEVFNTTLDKIKAHNSVLCEPAPRQEIRDLIYQWYGKKKYKKVFQLMSPYSRWDCVKKRTKQVLLRYKMGAVVDVYRRVKRRYSTKWGINK